MAKSLFVRGIFRLKTVESGDETKFFDARNRAETELPYGGDFAAPAASEEL